MAAAAAAVVVLVAAAAVVVVVIHCYGRHFHYCSSLWLAITIIDRGRWTSRSF